MPPRFEVITDVPKEASSRIRSLLSAVHAALASPSATEDGQAEETTTTGVPHNAAFGIASEDHDANASSMHNDESRAIAPAHVLLALAAAVLIVREVLLRSRVRALIRLHGHDSRKCHAHED
jgi:hypothetical protein